jgi:hypothetical protein
MGFELFTKKGGRSTAPKITIARAGYIGFNTATMEKYLANKKFIQMYWDDNRGLIGFVPLDKEKDDAFSLSLHGNGPGSIAGKSFLKHYGIDFSKTRSFTPELIEKDNMLVIKVR